MTLPSNTEPKQNPENPSTGYSDPKTEDDPKEEPKSGEPEVDENGYTPAEDPKAEPKEEPKEEPKADEPEEIKDPATGYGKEDPKAEPKEEPKEEPKDPESEEGKLEAQIDESLGELPEGYSKDIIKKFALNNKMSPEQVKAYVELTKVESTQNEADEAQVVRDQRASWKNELVKDSEFGGENFDKNVDRVEKVLQNYLPETKKVLTDRGSMLPPYIMKDLLGLSKTLNPTTKLVDGEPGKPVVKDDGNFLENMYQ